MRKKICDRTYEWCTGQVKYINQTYTHMEKRIGTTPEDEQELVNIIEFIKESKERTKHDLEERLNAVFKHMEMLDDYNELAVGEKKEQYEEDVMEMFGLRSWPLRIDAAISDGQVAMDGKTEEFNVILEQEKEKFKRDLEDWREKFGRIKQFTDITKVNDFSRLANELDKDLTYGQSKIEDFNRREKLFKIKESEWPELKELSESFKPFKELITTAFDSKQYLQEWSTSRLMDLEWTSD